MKRFLKESLAGWIPLILLAFSLTINVVLIFRSHQAHKPVRASLTKGVLLPPIDVERLDGESERIEWSRSAQPTVVYVFSPSCPWCKKNLGNIQALISGAKAKYAFVGISLSDVGLTSYLAKYRLDMPVYFHARRTTIEALHLDSTPQTLLVSSTGRLIQEWKGAYGPSTQSAVEKIFNVRLPGWLPPTQATTPE